jgi:hypothetical protein
VREAVLHLDDSGHAIDIHFNGEKEGTPINAFLLLTSVSSDPPGCHLLSYGNSNLIGNAIMTFFQRSVHEHPEAAWMMEQVARGIVKFSDDERSRWPSGKEAGNS